MPQVRPHRLNMRILVAFALLLLSTASAEAAILFEGWSKVLMSGKHVGYIVQRYEFDEKKKQFTEIHFLKTNPDSGGLTESLVAKADASFKPISYQYTGMLNEKPLLIDATIKGDKLTAAVTEGKEKKTIKNTIPKDAFLSTFLGYVMLQGKDGLKKGVKYSYNAILEETGQVAKGEAYISDEETVGGIPVFRVLNTINGTKFISLASHKAEILGTVSPSISLQTVLVTTLEEAVAGFGLNNAALTRLFGGVPKGKENELVRRASKPAPAPAAPAKPGDAKAAAPAAGASAAPATAPKAEGTTVPSTAPATSPTPAAGK